MSMIPPGRGAVGPTPGHFRGISGAGTAGSAEPRHGGPQPRDPLAGLGRGRQHLGEGRGVAREVGVQPLEHLRELALPRLVALGQHRLEADGRAVEQIHDLVIRSLHPVARIDQHEGPAQARPACEIGAEQRLPGLDLRLRRLGEAVARQIDQIRRLAEREVVDLLRPARRVRGPRKPPTPRQRVDERGLADVRAPGEADLGTVRRRQRIERDHPLEKIAGPRE